MLLCSLRNFREKTSSTYITGDQPEGWSPWRGRRFLGLSCGVWRLGEGDESACNEYENSGYINSKQPFPLFSNPKHVILEIWKKDKERSDFR